MTEKQRFQVALVRSIPRDRTPAFVFHLPPLRTCAFVAFVAISDVLDVAMAAPSHVLSKAQDRSRHETATVPTDPPPPVGKGASLPFEPEVLVGTKGGEPTVSNGEIYPWRSSPSSTHTPTKPGIETIPFPSGDRGGCAAEDGDRAAHPTTDRNRRESAVNMQAATRIAWSKPIKKDVKTRSHDRNKGGNGASRNGASEESFVNIAEVLRNVGAVEKNFVFEADDEEPEDPWIGRIADSFNTILDTVEEPKSAAGEILEEAGSAYSEAQGFKQIDVGSLEELLDGEDELWLVDVREKQEYSQGRLPDSRSRNVPFEELGSQLKDGVISKDVPIYTLCNTGTRSAQAAVRLSKVYGFKNVTNVLGGIRAWKEAGFAILEDKS